MRPSSFLKYSLLLLLCHLVQPALCQPHVRSGHFSIEEGMSDRNVTSICQDQQGFLWIGTHNGLNRFDGYQFLAYDTRPRSRHKISNSYIDLVMPDRSGRLLAFSGKKSFDLLDPASGKLTPMPFNEQHGYKGERIVERLGTDGAVYSLAKSGGNSVIHRFHEKSGRFERLFEDPHWIERGVGFLDFIRAADGSFWVCYEGNYGELSIIHADSTGRTLQALDNADFARSPSVVAAGVRLVEVADGAIWLSIIRDGVYVLEKGGSVFKPHLQLPKGDFFFVKDRRGNLLVHELFPRKMPGSTTLFTADGQRLDYGWLAEKQANISAFYSDDFREWLLAGSSDGLFKHWLPSAHFATFLKKDLRLSSKGNSIRGMAKDGQGRLLIATETDGVFELDLKTDALSRPSARSPQLYPLDTVRYTRNLLPQGDSVIWVTHQYGLVKYLPGKNTLRLYFHPYEIQGAAFGEDGNIWLALLDNRLMRFDPLRGIFSEYKNKDGSQPLANSRPNYLAAGQGGTFWAGTVEAGLVKIDTKNGTSRRFTANEGDPTGLNSNTITCISPLPAAEGGEQLWLGTMHGGLHLFDVEKGRVTAIFTKENGLGHNSVAGILPLRGGAGGVNGLWVSTFGGLSFFDSRLKTFRNYSTADGLSHNEFNRHSFFHDPETDRYFFGGVNGLSAFYEKDLLRKGKPAPLLIAEASFSGGGDSTVTLTEGIVSGSLIALPPDRRFLHLRLALADYLAPPSNQFSYKIEGLDEDWNFLGKNHDLRLNHLPAGAYSLLLRAADSQGNWTGDDFHIRLVVREFWYRRWWAWLLYAGLLGLGVYLFYRFRLRQRLAHQEAVRLQELDEFKSRFFTNITHEFRTPLTVILGMAERLESDRATQSHPVTNTVALIKRNGENLLRLINQILDLAKLESNTLKINYVQGDVLPYLRYITESLHSLANAQNVLLRVESPEGEIVMDYDPERLLQIVHNLLSNAIKFTPSGGKVTLRAEQLTNHGDFKNHHDFVHLTVSDTGIGIPPEDLPKIFDRFYQAENQEHANAGGTGIGLSLTKELVKAMGGEISVESEVGKGTTFAIKLPINQSAPASDRVTWSHPVTLAPVPKSGGDLNLPNGELPSILLIEDNPDVVEYLAACLQGQFALDYAYNGRAGIEKALEAIPDLIISDVMMPEKDGFEVCDTLKNDERSSHIPIILLTAKADVESRIAGLKRGADAYLAKPFHQEELLVTLQNLLELRRRLQAKYAEFSPAPIITHPSSLIPDPEDAFLQKIRALVEKNLSDADFEMPQLERGLVMSRSQIFRKVKALTGKSPSLFIRSIRLARAKELLAAGDLNVSEVAYETGFSSPVYFSNAYLEEFGVRPSEERK